MKIKRTAVNSSVLRKKRRPLKNNLLKNGGSILYGMESPLAGPALKYYLVQGFNNLTLQINDNSF